MVASWSRVHYFFDPEWARRRLFLVGSCHVASFEMSEDIRLYTEYGVGPSRSGSHIVKLQAVPFFAYKA